MISQPCYSILYLQLTVFVRKPTSLFRFPVKISNVETSVSFVSFDCLSEAFIVMAGSANLEAETVKLS